MSSTYLNGVDGNLKHDTSSPLSPSEGAVPGRNSMLSNKLTSVLSQSYADPEIRDILSILDARGVVNDASARRRLRFDAQKEIIECNGAIVQDFGIVAEVKFPMGGISKSANNFAAVGAYRHNDRRLE